LALVAIRVVKLALTGLSLVIHVLFLVDLVVAEDLLFDVTDRADKEHSGFLSGPNTGRHPLKVLLLFALGRGLAIKLELFKGPRCIQRLRYVHPRLHSLFLFIPL
jgi:hypothetical protein